MCICEWQTTSALGCNTQSTCSIICLCVMRHPNGEVMHVNGTLLRAADESHAITSHFCRYRFRCCCCCCFGLAMYIKHAGTRKQTKTFTHDRFAAAEKKSNKIKKTKRWANHTARTVSIYSEE